MKRPFSSSDEQMRPGALSKTTRVVSARATAVRTTTIKRRKTDHSSAAIMSTSTAVVLTDNSTVAPNISTETFESLELDTMGATWYKTLTTEFSKPYFRELKKFIVSEQKQYTIYPPHQDIYSWSRLTPLDSVKAVIIGQDPYHDVGQAHGLAFSVLPPTKIPPSLRNIYKQIKADMPSFVVPTSGDLTLLTKQGVLWLNTCLTVRAHKANSHSGKGWETFTSEVIRAILSREHCRGIVIFAWGIPAQKTCDKIGIDESKHLVLRSAHPSPLSAHRGFLGNGHFKSANNWLRNRYGDGEEIDWTVLNSNS